MDVFKAILGGNAEGIGRAIYALASKGIILCLIYSIGTIEYFKSKQLHLYAFTVAVDI